jgi:hypothetical protein
MALVQIICVVEQKGFLKKLLLDRGLNDQEDRVAIIEDLLLTILRLKHNIFKMVSESQNFMEPDCHSMKKLSIHELLKIFFTHGVDQHQAIGRVTHIR